MTGPLTPEREQDLRRSNVYVHEDGSQTRRVYGRGEIDELLAEIDRLRAALAQGEQECKDEWAARCKAEERLDRAERDALSGVAEANTVLVQANDRWAERVGELEREVAALREALERIEQIQPKVLAYIRASVTDALTPEREQEIRLHITSGSPPRFFVHETAAMAHELLAALDAARAELSEADEAQKACEHALAERDAALDAARAERDERTTQRDEVGRMCAEAIVREDKLKREVAALREALSKHHAVGVMDGTKVGDKCPICAALAGGEQDKPK